MKRILLIVPGLIAGVVGGALGVYLFEWAANQGFYALIVPGALAGLACGLCSPGDSKLRGGLAAVVALFAGLVAEWKVFPFRADKTFSYFLTHVNELKPLTLFMLGVGTFLGFWWGREKIGPKRRTLEAASAKAPHE